MKIKIDLSSKSGTIGNVIKTNYEQLMSIMSPFELAEAVKKRLDEAGIDTPASRRLMMNLSKSKSVTNSQFILTNSLLKSQGLGV